MKATNIVVPTLLGDKGPIAWSKHEGDVVAAGETVLEVDIGYAKVPVHAPRAGRLTKITLQDGHDVHEGMTVAVLQPDANEPVDAPPPIDVCSSCGVVREERAVKCARCGAAHESRARRATRDGSTHWVCVECAFTCRACGFAVPLGHIDMDGVVLCARCGLEQAFEFRAWHDAFDYAHAVAEDSVASTRLISEANAFQVTASPGRPVCESCHAFLDVAFTDGGRATATCEVCKTSAAYVVPEAAGRMTKQSLTAVLAAEHRTDREAVKVEQTAGAIAVLCPSCSAALDASDGTRLVRCKYCNTTSHIPTRVWFRLGGKEPKPEPMWLAFIGKSRVRLDADRERANEERKAMVERLREAKRNAGKKRDAERRAEKADADDAKAGEKAKEKHAREEAEWAEKQNAIRAEQAADARSKRSTNVIVVVMLAFGAMVVVAMFLRHGC
jgi:LSD1 subclass zinc finger protein